MQHGHCGHELADDAERGVGVDVDRVLFGGRQHLGQAGTGRVLRHDAEHGPAFETIDSADASVRAVTEVGEAIDPFAERELERGDRDEFRGQAENAELVAGFFGEADADAETIGEIRRGWRGRRGRRGFHEGPRARAQNGCPAIARTTASAHRGNCRTTSRANRPSLRSRIGTNITGGHTCRPWDGMRTSGDNPVIALTDL